MVATSVRVPAAVAAVTFVFVWTMTTHGKYSASGDEPHYLMLTHSLVVDGDLDLADNYARNDGRHVGHDGLAMGLHAVSTPSGAVRSIHGLGLPVLLAPGYVATRTLASLPDDALLARLRMTRGLLTYAIVSLAMAALTALGLALLTAALMTRLPHHTAAAVVLVTGLSPPVMSHAFLIFPDTVAFVATCAVVWMACRTRQPDDLVTVLLLVAALGWLPWLHHKFALYVPGLVGVLLWSRRALLRAWSRPLWMLAVALLLAPQVALAAWSWHEWGTPAGALTTGGLPFSLDLLGRGLVGLWIDRRAGLLAAAPIYLLVPIAWTRGRQSHGMFVAPVLLLMLPAAAFTLGWWGGFAPAARYLLPLTPCFALVVADALHDRVVRTLAIVLLVPQLALDATAWQTPRRLWPSTQGNPLLHSLGPPGRAWERALPDLQPPAPAVEVSVSAASGALH